MMRVLLLLAAFLSWSGAARAADLLSEIRKGSIEIVSLRGNGSSSGMALEGALRNRTSGPIELDVRLPNPIYFASGPTTQDMAATQIYSGGGRYSKRDGRSFITLRPGATSSVVFIAYCVDFDLDNPEDFTSFAIADMPPDLAGVMRKISAFEAGQGNRDVTDAAQVALWLSRGETREEIEEKFDFTEADLGAARRMLR